MNWRLLVTNPARKELGKLPSRERTRITRALALLQEDPFRGDIKRLEPAGWRRRAGNYRIFYDLDVEARLIVVTAIVRRTSTTY
jgi:mRNA-degrading endonuclease RelE of RelBE toxin-antitoxin system